MVEHERPALAADDSIEPGRPKETQPSTELTNWKRAARPNSGLYCLTVCC